MNDCNYWADDLVLPQNSHQSFVANIEEIVDQPLLRSSSLLSQHQPSFAKGIFHYSDLTYDQSNEQYNCPRDAYKDMVAKGKPVTLIDMRGSCRHTWRKLLPLGLKAFLKMASI